MRVLFHRPPADRVGMRVNEAVVISLPERAERRSRLMAALPQPWPFPALHVVEGVRATPPAWFKSSPGAYGCQQAHLKVLQSAWERGVESTLILEDDAMFGHNFVNRWRQADACIPANWSMVMLGGEHIQAPRPHGFSLVRVVETRRTHAYIIRLRAIPFLIRTWSHSVRHIDHALKDFQHAAYVYAPTQFLIGQSAGPSDISNKQNEARFWIKS
jgi:hypothetical protein